MLTPIVILGTTASGKSDLAEALAAHLHIRFNPDGTPNGHIMAVDSMQIYRTMDIGTAKPSPQSRAQFPYLMLDQADPWQSYSAAKFTESARPFLTQSKIENQKSKIPPTLILVAGTFLYLRALIEGLFEGPSANEPFRAHLHQRATAEGTAPLHHELTKIDPLAASRIHQNDLRRIIRALEVHHLTGSPISTLQTQWSQAHPAIQATYIGIRRDKESLNRRINARVKSMLTQGLLQEVQRLHQDPRGFSDEAASATGYKQLLDYFQGKSTLDDAIEQIKIQTRSLAKMQRTWLKRWPPPSQVHWLDATDSTTTQDLLQQTLHLLANK